MHLSRTVRLFLALVSGVALALAYPLYSLPLLGWFAPALLILAVLGERPRFGFLLGLLQGALSYGLSVPWVYTVLRHYGPLPVIQAGAVFALLILATSLFHAAFAGLTAWVSRYGLARACLAAPFLWVTMEFAMGRLPAIGFPWNLLGYVAAGNLAFVQLTTITGIFGLSLLVASYNSLLAWVALQFLRGKKSGSSSTGFSLWGLVLAYIESHRLKPVLLEPAFKAWSGATAGFVLVGLVGQGFVPQPKADHVAHLVQTNFPVAMNYPADWMQAHVGEMDELEHISIDAGQKMPGPIIWPEVPAPFSLQDRIFQARAERIARGAGNGFLVGVVNWKQLPDGREGASNSAALLGPDGKLDFIYDKIHLVPFSEYIPWRKWLFFAKDLTGLVGDFQPGSQYKVGNISGGPFSVYICYEAIFPNEVRRFTLAGAQLFVNISDDGWFGGSGAPAQHLAMARVRAVENRRWLLRDTNDGITVSVDPYGRIVARLPEHVRGELDAPFAFCADLTLFARWGDWIAWLCVLAAIVLLWRSVRSAIARRNS
jgi:apolipoprotein N-acyltransferase